jgi:hypothetical protein
MEIANEAIGRRRADFLVHADWGSDPKKRWMCVGVWEDVRYRVGVPELVGDLRTFWQRLHERAGSGSLVVGFDFPIGLPAAFAEKAGLASFKLALPVFGHGEWEHFYQLAERPGEISCHRPFYPRRPGGTKQSHLEDGLGISSMRDLLRRCERPTEDRGAASPLFWTLGGKQVGRAAIIGWRDLLAPGLADPSLTLKLWPFDGNLADLVEPGAVVVAETYPAEACVHLGLGPPGRGWSKRSQEGRQAQAHKLLAWAEACGVHFEDDLRELIKDGFGERKDAEDPFDALLGLLSMIEVALGVRDEGAPLDRVVREVEGWILGQKE